MEHRALGKTGIRVAAVAFGAGPVPALLTGADSALQRATVERALEAGVNWFDTAATYGDGESEQSLGRVLRELGAVENVHVATKVRLLPGELEAIPEHVRASFEGSLARLGLERVTLLQLHNAVTARRGDEPTSITPDDVLGPGGALEALARLRSEGRVRHLGITGLGRRAALLEVLDSGAFETVQAPYSLVNPSAGGPVAGSFAETDHGDLITECAARGIAFFAIRVYAGGALAGAPPSGHTRSTKFFPLDLYRRDEERAAALAPLLAPHGISLGEAALRFALSDPRVSSAIVGFGAPSHVDEAVRFLRAGPLSRELCEALRARAAST
jgi:aryl-alcohol dehydrogenase-like predicted oxidoreductase